MRKQEWTGSWAALSDSSPLPGQNPRVHAGEDVFKRNERRIPGVDLGDTPLNFHLPCGIDLRIAGATSGLKQLPNQPIEFAGR